MANFKITPKTSTVLVITVVALVAAFAFYSVVFRNRPIQRVSLPAGTEFPACLLDDAPTCSESTKCVHAAPGGLTYGRFHQPVAAFGKNWCCPDKSTAKVVGSTVMCIVD
jgi:hypothetical protein